MWEFQHMTIMAQYLIAQPVIISFVILMLIMFIITINRCGRHSCDLLLQNAFLSHFALILHVCETEMQKKQSFLIF